MASKEVLVIEGTLDLEKQGFICIDRPGTRCDRIEPQLVGMIRRETGGTNVAYVEHVLWQLNHKKVKITISIE